MESAGSSGERRAGGGARPWIAAALSVLGSAAAVAAAGCLCALVYPILRELRSEMVRGENGTEEKILGFWSVLLLSLCGGCICWLLSWTLTYLHMHQPSSPIPPPASPTGLRVGSGHPVCMDYGVAFLNGVLAMLTVIWSLS
ncbi:ADP-ribosylation factor-like protein 6-interacting protein 6 [Oryzias melastigma]|uniref:ADP ribosylation factor like GTPase 6 interacting protein 6 n=1 Tax=Oryzias melastigma TaxID=30732 RepID=A0A3B3DCA7_ORYME|nr:ADP-ribosylation factor-like protein 6-interacting protein 6 [Oryzias melastigma]KAF6724292.1 ADP-ribosylation factor-like protein 6-interacting protein 6 [Oryzias melastigma]